MRLARPKPCCAPISSVRNTIRSSVPCRIPGSLVDIQDEYEPSPLECQQEDGGLSRITEPSPCDFAPAIQRLTLLLETVIDVFAAKTDAGLRKRRQGRRRHER